MTTSGVTAEATASHSKIARRPKRSDSQPIGHCDSKPPAEKAAIKLATWAVENPELTAYTAPNP